ncbi:MAG: hypothetical protein ACOYL6_18200 [Bacteriovoracaceae bacterium]
MKWHLLFAVTSLLFSFYSRGETRIYELGSPDERGRLTARQTSEIHNSGQRAIINEETFEFHDGKTYSFKANHVIHLVTRETILAFLAERGIPARPKALPAYGLVASSSGGLWNKKFPMLDFYSFCGQDDFCAWQGKIYDSFDFGNLLWGAAVRWLKVGYVEAKMGSELNELFGSYRGFHFRFDSQKDQQAIKEGYFYGFKSIFQGLNPRLTIKENLEN